MVSENTMRYVETEREIERILAETSGCIEVPLGRQKYLNSLYENLDALEPEIEL